MTQVSFSFAMIVLLGAGLAQDPSPAPQQASTPAQSQAQPSTPGSDKNQNALPPTEQSKAALPTKVIPGSRLFVASMQGNLDGFISAEIVKKKLSVIVTTEENTADYVLTGTSIKADDKWYHTVFGGKDKTKEMSPSFESRTRRSYGLARLETDRCGGERGAEADNAKLRIELFRN